jgi:Rrf2 family nitric oxide-sensitive transcriptional repressor
MLSTVSARMRRRMRLTRYTDYALRVLIYCGLAPDGRVTIREIGEAYGISRNHLTKIVHDLGRLGYVATVRGKGGGLRLAMPPGEIRLGELVATLERDLALAECFGDGRCDCRIAGECRLQGMLAEALEAFFATLDRWTLADLLEPGAGLCRRLGLPLPA